MIGIHIEECEEVIWELEEEANKFKRTPIDSSILKKLDEDADAIVDRIEQILQLLLQQAIDGVQDDVEDFRALLKLVRPEQLSSELQMWLKAPDAPINFNEAHKKKYPRARFWLV
ncbi:hypothetical protein F5Y09DRAFT_339768 [Xylaria sp. FL1042]|nr:hypothetical protein F5Y09DRAFT_339768 [Xylaria sp. FL1042]